MKGLLAIHKVPLSIIMGQSEHCGHISYLSLVHGVFFRVHDKISLRTSMIDDGVDLERTRIAKYSSGSTHLCQ